MKKDDEFVLTILWNKTITNITNVITNDLAMFMYANETKYNNIDPLWCKQYIVLMHINALLTANSEIDLHKTLFS